MPLPRSRNPLLERGDLVFGLRGRSPHDQADGRRDHCRNDHHRRKQATPEASRRQCAAMRSRAVPVSPASCSASALTGLARDSLAISVADMARAA